MIYLQPSGAPGAAGRSTATSSDRDLETLVLAGELTERAGFPEPVMPPDSSLTPVPVDIASLNPDMLRLADRGARELLGMPLDRLGQW